MPRSEVHVIPREGQWVVEAEGHGQMSWHNTQTEAIDRAREFAAGQGSQLVVHGEDGAIREKDSFGPDPRDIPG